MIYANEALTLGLHPFVEVVAVVDFERADEGGRNFRHFRTEVMPSLRTLPRYLRQLRRTSGRLRGDCSPQVC